MKFNFMNSVKTKCYSVWVICFCGNNTGREAKKINN